MKKVDVDSRLSSFVIISSLPQTQSVMVCIMNEVLHYLYMVHDIQTERLVDFYLPPHRKPKAAGKHKSNLQTAQRNSANSLQFGLSTFCSTDKRWSMIYNINENIDRIVWTLKCTVGVKSENSENYSLF